MIAVALAVLLVAQVDAASLLVPGARTAPVDDVAAELGELYGALPLWAQVLNWIALAVIVSSLVSLIVLLIAAARYRRTEAQAAHDTASESEFLWVFVVPALNERVTIADSVQRLQQTTATHALFVIIDDGSDDGTGEIVRAIDDARIRVLTRHAPDARRGKAAALNAAYRVIDDAAQHDETLARWGADRTIVVVVDADGRLDPRTPERTAALFADPTLGGLQVLVRIYNRWSPLTWAQDVEFTAFGRIFQAGRSLWGTANLGGNGQLTRLSALRDVAGSEGPWRDRLTEDQDLGVRMIHAGWRNVQDNTVSVAQQGLNSLRRLYRQRVRWAQGNWQSMSLLPGAFRMRQSLIARIDSVYYLITPALQLFTGIAFVTTTVVWLLGLTDHVFPHPWVLVLFLGMSIGPGYIALLLQHRRWYGPLLAVLLVLPYVVYSWLVFPVLTIALIRQLAGRRGWAKTDREPLDEGETTLV